MTDESEVMTGPVWIPDGVDEHGRPRFRVRGLLRNVKFIQAREIIDTTAHPTKNAIMTDEQLKSQIETLAEAVKAAGPELDKEQTMLTLSALVAWCAMHQDWNSTGIAQFLRITHEGAIQAMISRDLATKGRIDCDCGECDADTTRESN